MLSSSTSLTNSNSGNNNGDSQTNIPVIVGGVVGGVVGLGLIGALVAFFLLRSRRKPEALYESSFQQGPDMSFTPNVTASLVPTTVSPLPESSGKVYVS